MKNISWVYASVPIPGTLIYLLLSPHFSGWSTIGAVLLSVGTSAAYNTLVSFDGMPKQAYLRRLRAYFSDMCNTAVGYRCSLDLDHGKVIFTDLEDRPIGWVKYADDETVIESNTSPFHLDDLDTIFGEIYQQGVFIGPRAVGLRPAVMFAEGHIHVDFDSLFLLPNGKYDYLFFRNYILDWINHSELYWGALHYDTFGRFPAKPLLDKEDLRQNFRDWLEDYDGTLARGQMSNELFDTYLDRLYKKCGFHKGYAINISEENDEKVYQHKPDKKRTLELRSFRPKRDFESLKRNLQLIQARAQYLANLKIPLPYYDAGAPQSIQEGVNRIGRYFSESGLAWEQYKLLLPRSWQSKSPVDLPDEQLFKPGRYKAGFLLRCRIATEIHLLNW